MLTCKALARLGVVIYRILTGYSPTPTSLYTRGKRQERPPSVLTALVKDGFADSPRMLYESRTIRHHGMSYAPSAFPLMIKSQ